MSLSDFTWIWQRKYRILTNPKYQKSPEVFMREYLVEEHVPWQGWTGVTSYPSFDAFDDAIAYIETEIKRHAEYESPSRVVYVKKV